MKLQFLEPIYSVCQLPADAPTPEWAQTGFLAHIRTDEEFTIILPTSAVPTETKAQHNFICFRIAEELAFDVIGVIANISHVLADAKIPILSVSTYNTDYFLIAKTNQNRARLALTHAQHEFLS